MSTTSSTPRKRKQAAILVDTPASSSSSKQKTIVGLRSMGWEMCRYLSNHTNASFTDIADHCGDDSSKSRRRAYDALNVLVGASLVSKHEDKSLTWNDTALRETQQRIQDKRTQLKELLTSLLCYSNLVRRNQRHAPHERTVGWPCLLLRTDATATLTCEMSAHRDAVSFQFSRPFDISDDTTVLQQLGFHRMDRRTLQQVLAPDILAYCSETGLLEGLLEEAL